MEKAKEHGSSGKHIKDSHTHKAHSKHSVHGDKHSKVHKADNAHGKVDKGMHEEAHSCCKSGTNQDNGMILVLVLIGIATLLILFNQFQIGAIKELSQNSLGSSGSYDVGNIDLDSIKSTGHTLAAVFPTKEWKSSDDVMADLFPTGTPDYGNDLGVSFDEPVKSLEVLAKMYRGLKQEVETNNPEGWQRFMNLASKPVGISCEYCCGVGPIGIDKRGNSACGCQHNPALLSVALYLSAYTDYSDAQILREVMRWKTLFFPKNMIELGTSLAGGDASSLKELPGMVGGC